MSDENTCFLRSKDVDIKLCLLFELCMTVAGKGLGDYVLIQKTLKSHADGVRFLFSPWTVARLRIKLTK
jgi:hypothetical protein